MKQIALLTLFAIAFSLTLHSQTAILMTNTSADDVLKGNYNPASYLATDIINHPDSIMPELMNLVSEDSLRVYLEKLESFRTRNTGSDTVSQTTGIGAARRWVHSKFVEFSAANESRLLPGYLQFNLNICSAAQHRNVVAVLPGMDTSDQSVILIEAHLDSRCDNGCDITCAAYGADDNGSGSVLVIEMARVLSKFSFNHTVVFMLTTGEEQGLYGADAMADYVQAENIKVKAVQNNDVIGGVICGNTASPPGCSPVGTIDSVNLRIFSFGSFNSPHKGFARWVKLQYMDEAEVHAEVKSNIEVQALEDRSGRGGDHIPFRQKAITAIRFTSANEHGDGNPSQTGYIDHQHTSGDSIGVDTDGNGSIDSLFVDFNYLARNTRINATSTAMLAIGPKKPMMTATGVQGGVVVDITDQTQYDQYRVGLRTTTNDWDTLYDMNSIHDTIWGVPSGTIMLQAMSVDTNGIESLPSFEVNASVLNSAAPIAGTQKVVLLQNRPNPFDEATWIGVDVSDELEYGKAWIAVMDLQGKEIKRISIELNPGINEIAFNHGFSASGIYLYSLVIDEEVIDTKRMVFAW